MALKSREIKRMGKKELEEKLKELKLELVKSRVEGSSTSSSKTREIKKMIAQILTFNK